ncbi:MAG TPA: nicotinate (nicotinamide) nucleotide adenylyltransferase [Bacteroidia bacterium]
MKRALFFGSFNPIHIGHLIIAQSVLNLGDSDQVEFVLSPQNPFKTSNELLPLENRLNFLETSIKDHSQFSVNTIEFELPIPSFTSTTLSELKLRFPNDTFSLIMGSDTLAALPNWKSPETILQHDIYVYPRPGEHLQPYQEHKNIIELKSSMLDISATEIRNLLNTGKSVKYLVRDEIIEDLTRLF